MPKLPQGPRFEIRALSPGIATIDEAAAVFDSMITGWETQQQSRQLAKATIEGRSAILRRFAIFTQAYPWEWGPTDLEDFTSSLASRSGRLGHSTIRGYHIAIRLFCGFVTDPAYPWMAECQKRFGQAPSQICNFWNTVAHLNGFEGRPNRRPLDYDEIQKLFDEADSKVERLAVIGRKGSLAAYRDAQMIKTIYAFGLRRREIIGLDVRDLRSNPAMPAWGRYGSLNVRFGKSSSGGPPKRRTVHTIPEFDWVVTGLQEWVEQARPKFPSPEDDALWVTERATRVSPRYLDLKFAELRNSAGLDPHLTLHSLRHSYVTHLIEFGYAERFVQEQVGHSYSSTTAIYTSVSSDFKTRVLEQALKRIYGREEIGLRND